MRSRLRATSDADSKRVWQRRLRQLQKAQEKAQGSSAQEIRTRLHAQRWALTRLVRQLTTRGSIRKDGWGFSLTYKRIVLNGAARSDEGKQYPFRYDLGRVAVKFHACETCDGEKCSGADFVGGYAHWVHPHAAGGQCEDQCWARVKQPSAYLLEGNLSGLILSPYAYLRSCNPKDYNMCIEDLVERKFIKKHSKAFLERFEGELDH